MKWTLDKDLVEAFLDEEYVGAAETTLRKHKSNIYGNLAKCPVSFLTEIGIWGGTQLLPGLK